MIDIKDELIYVKLSKDFLISRCRINIPYNKKFLTKNEVFMPPASSTKLCRANKKGQRVFYGTISDKSKKNDNSYNRITALFEVSDFIKDDNSEGIEVVTCSYWQSQWNLRLVALPLLDNYENPTELMLNINSMWDRVNHESADIQEISRAFSRSVVNLTEEEKNSIYEKTSSFVDDLFKNKDIDGVIYPSVALNGDGLCLALKEEVAIEALKLVDVIILNLFKKKKMSKYIIREICHVEDDNMLFQYKRHPQGDTAKMMQYKNEFDVDYINK